MNPSVSCRQLSPRIALAILLVLTVFVANPASAAATVQGVSVATDRTDYVNVPGFNVVTSTATVDFNGNGPLDGVRFDWIAPSGGPPFRVRYVTTRSIMPGRAAATDVWTADREGVGFTVLATINTTVGSPPPVASAPATFNVFNRTWGVVVTDVVVTTSPVYENGTVATARAALKYAGNSSYLAGVRFDWYYPDWSPAWTSTDPNPQAVSNNTAFAYGTWTIDAAGRGFHVNATYLGGTPVTNTTAFDVVERLVLTDVPGNVGPGSRLILDASTKWRVCFNMSVDNGGELVVLPGTELRFCRGTGLFVNGTLTVDALSGAPAYFLSLTPVGVPMRAGDWRGITFYAAAPADRSILSNAVIQAVTEGVTVQGTAVRVLNSRIALATGPAVWLQASSSLVGNTTIGQSDIGIREDGCTGAVLDSNVIQGARVGVLLENSVGTLSANDISLSVDAGLQAVQSQVTVDGGSFRDDGNTGVYLSGVPQAQLTGVSISGGNDSIVGEDSRGIVIDLSTLVGARYRAAYMINATSTFVNSTLAALQRDLVLVASPTTLVNSTTAAPNLQFNSVITVRNFLHVLVESNLPGLARVANAWANVTSDSVTVSSRRTTASGWSQWILLTDRVILDSTRTRFIANVVEVAFAGYGVISSPRSVDMGTSHVERFLVVPANSNPAFFLGIDGMVLVTIAVLMGTLLIVMPVVRRRRQTNGNVRPRSPSAVALEPGTSYLLPDEKPDRAFGIFSSRITNGAKGLVISRIYPDEARRRYGLAGVPILWLSRGYGRETVNPTNLGALVHEIERFASGKEDPIVLLDGLEYLLVQNDPQKIVKFVEALADTASVHHAKLLIPFDVKSVNETQRALITRDLQTL